MTFPHLTRTAPHEKHIGLFAAVSAHCERWNYVLLIVMRAKRKYDSPLDVALNGGVWPLVRRIRAWSYRMGCHASRKHPPAEDEESSRIFDSNLRAG
jgi:hypothetical protein